MFPVSQPLSVRPFSDGAKAAPFLTSPPPMHNLPPKEWPSYNRLNRRIHQNGSAGRAQQARIRVGLPGLWNKKA
jgi:hypothetical protein